MESLCLWLLVVLAVLQVRAGALVGTATSVDAGPQGAQIELAMLWMSWAVLFIPGVIFSVFVGRNFVQEREYKKSVEMHDNL